MPEQITVELTDAQAAHLLAIAREEQPGATPAQVRAWAADRMKRALRREVLAIRRRQWWNEKLDAVAPIDADYDTDRDGLTGDWPDPDEVVVP